MAISFKNIPRNLRVPLAYFEMDNSLAGNATAIENALLLGSVATGAALPLNTPTLVSSADQVRALCGAGSAFGRQAQRWFQNNASVPLYLLAAGQATFTVSAGSIEYAGDVTSSGTIPLYIGSRRCPVLVATGDDAEAVAAATVAAINADPTLGVIGSIVPATPDEAVITAAQAGALGALDIGFAYAGAVGGETMPPGITATVTAMSAGAGSPNIATLLGSIGDAPFDYVICPYWQAANLNALDEFFNDTTGRWSWQSQLYGHGFTASRQALGDLSPLGQSRNGQHVSIMGFDGSHTPYDEWLTAYVGQVAGSLIVDPARPVQALPLIGVMAPDRNSRFTILERQVLYFDGISATYVTEDGTVYIDRLITTYRQNQWGAPDDSYLDVETMFTAQYFNRFMKNRILLKYPRHKLASDGTRFGVGQAIVTPAIIRAEMVAAYGELEEMGLMENLDGFEAALIVERNAQDPNRVDVLLPPDFVNQLRIFAALTQFRL